MESLDVKMAVVAGATSGAGPWVQVDHTDPEQVRALFARVRGEQGRLDVHVNDLTGDQHLANDMLSGKGPVGFWEYPIESGLAVQQNGVHGHLIAAHFTAPLLIETGGELIVEVTDSNYLNYNGVGVYYSLEKGSWCFWPT
jgi:NAD(P)-dependent dehydrogenase (short-subunit alcohol dehydrogenase family)